MTKDSSVEQALEVLRTADYLEGWVLGLRAGEGSRDYAAFARLSAAGEAAYAMELISQERAAGRLYGATLLCEIDPLAGRQALESMRSDESRVFVLASSLPAPATVGDVAAELLQKRKGGGGE